MRARDRQRKLVAKIDAALQRIEDGTYGYCEETGEPISLKRLEARPIATLSIEAQERHERRERVYREESGVHAVGGQGLVEHLPCHRALQSTCRLARAKRHQAAADRLRLRGDQSVHRPL